MITGYVSALHALLPITFRRAGLPDIALDFVVDTGFSGDLTLPITAIHALQLPYIESIYANLATDEEVELPVYVATILWNEAPMDVRVLGTGKRPLLGTGLLTGGELLIQFAENGLVTVESL